MRMTVSTISNLSSRFTVPISSSVLCVSKSFTNNASETDTVSVLWVFWAHKIVKLSNF